MVDRLYYGDSFLTSFDAVVTDIRLVSRTGGEALWQVALDRSAFYPTSGGQPFDKGNLTATSRNGAVLEIPIDEVAEDEQGEVWHYTAKPLVAGTQVHAAIDWERRLDHMQQHSGQHLLSAIFSRELGAHTVSFHLGDESSTIDLNTASIAHASLERVERLANEIIAQDRPITIRTVSRSEAESLLAAGQLRKLPERDGDIRLIEIEGVDLNACGGTHLRSTGQIGGLVLRSTEKVRQGLRVEFVCGLRAVAAARRDFGVLDRSGGYAVDSRPASCRKASSGCSPKPSTLPKNARNYAKRSPAMRRPSCLPARQFMMECESCGGSSPITTPTTSSCWRRSSQPVPASSLCSHRPNRSRRRWSSLAALKRNFPAVS